MTDRFPTIRTEGSILPADLLQRVAASDKSLAGLTPADYHLLEGEKLNEATNRSWNRLLGVWGTFQKAVEKLPTGDIGTSVTRDRWLLPLWQELGYGRLAPVAPVVIDDKTYPVSHGWQHTAIHLVGCRADLDKRGSRESGVGSRAGRTASSPTPHSLLTTPSPHSLVQELINRSERHLWAFVTNGFKLRILRDNNRLTRQAYVEFDLQAMFEGKVYADFALLWRLCHQSRVEAEKPHECRLEQWSKAAQEQGLRVLDQLRGGVEKTIAAFGRGFLACPANNTLRDKLRAGNLDAQDYYRQLLRLVYRLLFLFVAEDRDLLFDPNVALSLRDRKAERPNDSANTDDVQTPHDPSRAPGNPLAEREGYGDAARERYTRFYSTSRLRRLAERLRGTQHVDLYQMLGLVMMKLGTTGCPELALPALGGFLFSAEALPDLQGCQLANVDLLEAIRALALTSDGHALRPVDYRNLGSEELGSVYESLLELHPVLNAEAATFELSTASGHERKTTGTYYTPTSLITCLLDSALDPVLDEAVKGNREWGVGNRGEDNEHRVVSRSEGVAVGNEARQGVLLPDSQVSKRRTLWNDQPDSPSSGIHPGEHRGGERPREHGLVHPVSPHRTGKPEGTGNAFDPGDRGRALPAGSNDAVDETSGRTGANAPKSDPNAASEAGGSRESGVRNRASDSAASATPYSPLPTPTSSTPESRLLALRICDLACGSGHFLIAAAHRIAKRLAFVRTGEEEPVPEALRHALRDVIGHCIYGVDINPMAVELCKVALWMEALEPGKPLSFLDHHIQCGNSLLGTTPALLARGIPDDAFTAIEGDVKPRVAELKKQNKREREDFLNRQGYLFDPPLKLGNMAADFARLNSAPDGTLADVAAIQDRYAQLVRGNDYQFGRLLADTWCAAFVWKKDDSEIGKLCPTERDFRKVETHADHGLLPHVGAEVKRLREQYQFFHLHLAFPDVFRLPGKDESPENEETGWSGGFDVILANPPWERVNLRDQEWFAERRPEISNAPNAAARKRLIEGLRTKEPGLHAQFQRAVRQSEGESHLLRNSGKYPLCGRGDINVYTVFAEGMRNHLNARGRVGCVLPSGIATDDTTKLFFQDVVEKRSLVSLFDFENRANLFPAVDSRMKFCLFTCGSSLGMAATHAEVAFFSHQVEDLMGEGKRFSLTVDDIALLNPNSRTCPIFRCTRDAELTKAIYRRIPVLIKDGPPVANHWAVTLCRMLHMADDSNLFETHDRLEADGWVLEGNRFKRGEEVYVPLYEAKMVHHYDHRWATHVEMDPVDLPWDAKLDAFRAPLPRYWVSDSEIRTPAEQPWERNWLFAFRDITNTTNERTVITSVVPRYALNHKLPLIYLSDAFVPFATCLVGLLNSFVFDFVARQKLGGTSLTYFVFKQLPVLPPSTFETPCPWSGPLQTAITHEQFLLPRVLELTYTAWDLEPFARDCGYAGPPFRWDEERRCLLRAELDAAFFHLYLGSGEWGVGNREDSKVGSESATPDSLLPTPREAVAYILDTFPIVRRKDEQKYNGEYKTKTTILSIYDEMTKSIETGQPYQTHLNPPPADPRVAHPPREAT